MELFIVLLPLFIILAVFVWLASAILGSPPYLWTAYHLTVLEALWICQLATDNVSDSVFHFLFAASVYCGLGMLVCCRRVWRCVRS